MEFERAFEVVKSQFEIENLLPEQQQAVKAFFKNKNLFINLPTGYGKSLIFQSLPLIADVVGGKERGSSVMLVISPLTALMNDQVTKLNNLGIPSISLVGLDDPDLIQQVTDGLYIVVYTSPEYLLSSYGRDIIADLNFRTKLIGVSIDEAHCISHWGLSDPKHGNAFRKWYGCLGELRSLISDTCRLIILTATATLSTKKQILLSLHLEPSEVYYIEQSPNKDNLLYTKEYLDKKYPLGCQFGELIEEMKRVGVDCPRTIVYCQTRKQCSVLYRMFEIELGKTIYNGNKSPKNQMVQMFHAGTPKPVKEFICTNLSLTDGHIRILISTVAFGMGVDCKAVRRVIHFGPPKTVEAYVQECGRAGRDGQQSCCILLFNGLTSVHCDHTMKKFLETEECLRSELMSHFTNDKGSVLYPLHQCCINCAKKCDCGDCGDMWSPFRNSSDGIEQRDTQTPTRNVTTEAKEKLKEHLIKLQQNNLNNIKLENMVACPNVLLEFNMFHITQVIKKCHLIFSLKDVLQHVEIWRHRYAIQILSIIEHVFGDTGFECVDEGNEEIELTQYSEWSQIRDDSTLLELMDSTYFEGIDSLMDSSTSFEDF